MGLLTCVRRTLVAARSNRKRRRASHSAQMRSRAACTACSALSTQHELLTPLHRPCRARHRRSASGLQRLAERRRCHNYGDHSERRCEPHVWYNVR
jgi:hypothetical protein